jgi:hypothetical protein
MTDDVRGLVDRRWNEYGIDLDASANGSGRRSLRQLLRR